MPKRDFHNDYKGDSLNLPKFTTKIDLANPSKDHTNIMHHSHLGHTLLSPKQLGAGFFPDSRKSKK